MNLRIGIELRTLLLACLFILLFSGVAEAVQVRALWTLNPPEEQIDNYILYKRVETPIGKEEVGRVDGNTNEIIFEHEGYDSITYMLVAERDGLESMPDVRDFAPDPSLPPITVRPGQPVIIQFNIVE